MPVTLGKADGVTVLTVTSDPQSHCPPLCQLLCSLCYSPVCCSISQRLKGIQKTSQSVMGTLHIMVGLLNLGLGGILSSGHTWYFMDFPFWLGGLFILFGIVCILSEKFPSPCLVIVNVILNLAGAAFGITAIVLYSICIGSMWPYWRCEDYYYGRGSTVSPHKQYIQTKCMEGTELSLVLLRGINSVLIVLSVLELCVSISSFVLGIKALRGSQKKNDECIDDPELCKALLADVSSDPVV